MKKKLSAYPLFVKDPFFSIWSSGEELNNSAVIFWTGAEKPFIGLVEIDGVKYRFLGRNEGKTIKQTCRELNTFSTDYTFENDVFALKISCISPLPPTDLKLLSCPVCYMTYNFTAKKKVKEVKVSLKIEERICYDSQDENRKEDVRANVIKIDNYEAAYVGLRRQTPLSHSSDLRGADWGNFFVVGSCCDVLKENERVFISAEDSFTDQQKKGTFMIAYDDIASIYYYGEILRGYYFSEVGNIIDAIKDSHNNQQKYLEELTAFDSELKEKTKKYCEKYYDILVASLRQSVAGHKLVKDSKGRILFLSKECNSDGCIATVDVTYPSAPLFLLYNQNLVKGMLYPIFDFARMPIWKYPYAPHDAGMYPFVTGQLYAAKNGNSKYNKDIYVNFGKMETLPFYYLMSDGDIVYNPDKQMPVEESANMIILIYACYLLDKDITLFNDNSDLLKQWAEFLISSGPEYGRQLCTDDFAGHLDDNINLAIKATIAINCYGKLQEISGNQIESKKYITKAKEYAKKISDQAFEDGHLPIAFGSGEETFSLKYNLAFDEIFMFELFSKDLKEKEIAYYFSKENLYGIPLDSRLETSKTDWLIWTATISEDNKVLEKVIDYLFSFLRETKDRYPFPDWYNVKTAFAEMFRNRTVQGGLFMPLLKDKLTERK